MERDFEPCSANCPYFTRCIITGMLTLVSYCTYSHTLGADEHHLSNKELLALTDILQEDLTDRLKQIGLDFGDAQTTIGEVQKRLHSLGEHEIASNLRQHLDLGTSIPGNRCIMMICIK